MLQLLLVDSLNEPCVASTNLQWSTSTNQTKNQTSHDLVMILSKVHVHWFLNWIHKVLWTVFNVEMCSWWNLKTQMQTLFEHVSLWCMFFDPHPITNGRSDYKSNRITPAHLGCCGPKSVWGPITKLDVRKISEAYYVREAKMLGHVLISNIRSRLHTHGITQNFLLKDG